ncbi:MAG: hypothetical protein E7048_03695 [Lentisphaerae bacterium]|nr:hypothetical protein [Lentisphaerota bacterium]
MNYADIINVTENSALFSYELEGAGFAVLTIDGREYKSVEATGTGRFEVKDLVPGRFYEAELSGVKLEFTTLPAPEGEELGRFALISDPHVSLKDENRKGRFFIESAFLMSETLANAAKLGAEFAVMPGDITNIGTEDEYMLCDTLLTNPPIPLHLLPGNHDYPERGFWEKYLGPRRWCFEKFGFTWLAVDTSDGTLTAEDAALIKEHLDKGEKLIISSHYHLFEAPRINHNSCLGIKNKEEHKELLEELKNFPVMIYAGHQNICSCARFGKAVQLNLPQIPQFPCEWLLVRVFANGFYHQAIPITSEVMRQWSRRSGDAAADFYGERQWKSAYRLQTFEQSNFIWKD